MDKEKNPDTDRVIRAWAVENHKNVGKRGRISADLRKAYFEAFGTSEEPRND